MIAKESQLTKPRRRTSKREWKFSHDVIVSVELPSGTTVGHEDLLKLVVERRANSQNSYLDGVRKALDSLVASENISDFTIR